MLSNILNLIFPPQCLSCKARVPTSGTLCLECWQQVQFITDPMCACCGLPFEHSIGEHALCGECMNERPIYAHARAAFRYDEYSRKLITSFKYSDHTELAKIYATWLAKAGGELIATSDYIIPVPLHYWRFISRRYNQSALLAQALGKKTGIKYLPTALKRTRHTKAQTGLSKTERSKNVSGAFTLNTRYKSLIKGKNILLIDDVLTTGATINQCSKQLLKSGAMQVNVLTLARTIR
jgi:ComF family protein